MAVSSSIFGSASTSARSASAPSPTTSSTRSILSRRRRRSTGTANPASSASKDAFLSRSLTRPRPRAAGREGKEGAMRHLVMAALLRAAALLGSAPAAGADGAPVSHIAQGRLGGARDAGGERFLDITFPVPPVGPLRPRGPQAPPRWDGGRDAAE